MNPSIKPRFSPHAIKGAHDRFPNNSVDFFESSDFSIDCSSVELIEEIAKGSFGVVYHGNLDGTSYAVKIEDFHDGDEEHQEDQVNLLVELTILQSLPHPRLVKFFGAGCDNEKVMIIFELCSRGTLRDILLTNLPWKLRIRIALDVARGIQFLHEQDIIHRDVKTTNILITQEWEAKLCDFSFMCHEESSSKNSFVYGTTEFMSPEISLATDFTISADIFSFGIVLCELITGKKPCESFMNRCARDMFRVDEKELNDNIEEGCPVGLEVLTLLCCDVEPSTRPTVHSCVEQLEALMEELGGSDIEISPEVSVKYNADSNDKNCNKVKINSMESMNRNGSESNYDIDINARLNLLTFQVEELKNDNVRMNKELKILNCRKDGWVSHCYACENVANAKGIIGDGRSDCNLYSGNNFDNIYKSNDHISINSNVGKSNGDNLDTMKLRNQDSSNGKPQTGNEQNDLNPQLVDRNDSLLIILNHIQNQLNGIKKTHFQQLDENLNLNPPSLQLPIDSVSIQSTDCISYLTGGSVIGSGSDITNGNTRDLSVDAKKLQRSLNKDSMFRIVNQDTGEVMDLRNMDTSVGYSGLAIKSTDSMPISILEFPLTPNQKRSKGRKEKKRLEQNQKPSSLPQYTTSSDLDQKSDGNLQRYRSQHDDVSNMLSSTSLCERDEIQGGAISKYMSTSEYDPANNLQSTLTSYLETITKANHIKSNNESDKIPYIQTQPHFRSSAQIRMNSLSGNHLPSQPSGNNLDTSGVKTHTPVKDMLSALIMTGEGGTGDRSQEVFDAREFSSTDADIDDEEALPRTTDSTDSLVGLHTR